MCCVATDPAADAFNYPASIDIRDLVTLEDVMEQLELGPNGCAHASLQCRLQEYHMDLSMVYEACSAPKAMQTPAVGPCWAAELSWPANE